MINTWLAEVGADPKQRAREIARAHRTFISTRELSAVAPGLRDVVARSWERSSQADVGQGVDPPVILTDDSLASYQAAHPLSAVISVLRHLVGTTAEDGEGLMAVSDAAGRLLWVEGHRWARGHAERRSFIEGAWWDEAHAGTNAPGTALALDHEVQIFATEHFRAPVQAWTCAAAPIHDPATGQVLGVIDITGGDGFANPFSLALVRSAARAAEAELARQPSGLWVPRTDYVGRLAVLGRNDGVLHVDGRAIRLHRRHTEVVIMLLLHPGGLTGEEITSVLYDDRANPATLQVEMTRLRHIVGDLLASRPYRLTKALRADFLDVHTALRANDLRAAVDAYRGPLLTSSDAIGIIEQRDWLETQLRSAVLASSDPDLVHSWADRVRFEDLSVWERLAAIAPVRSEHRAIAEARIHCLRSRHGLHRDARFE